MELYTVIMAGGAGTRFWPKSRKLSPKQLLPLGPTDEPLLAATVRRIAPVSPPENVLIVTNEALVEGTQRALPDVPPENILAEPTGRNTAPCVAWAAAHVRRRNPKGVLTVLPADHHIADEAELVRVLTLAGETAQKGALVTLGIRPDRPETGYGYLEVGDEVSPGVNRAKRFVEKPDATKAQQFLDAGTFLWNSGMFFFRADVILGEFERHLPELYAGIERFDKAAADGNEGAVVKAEYGDLPSISLDYGIMEKADEVLVVPADFGWNDLGSWTTAWDLSAKDADGNAVPEGSVLVDAKRTYISAPDGKLVAVVGLDDLVVVDTPDALLVMPRSRAQDVRAVVDELKKRNDKRL